MIKFQVEKQLIQELRETKSMLNDCELEYDVLIGFIQGNNLENELNQYLYANIKDCDDKEQLEAYLRLINEQEEDVQPTIYIGSNVFIEGVPVNMSTCKL